MSVFYRSLLYLQIHFEHNVICPMTDAMEAASRGDAIVFFPPFNLESLRLTVGTAHISVSLTELWLLPAYDAILEIINLQLHGDV